MNKVKLKKANELREQMKAAQKRIDKINSGISQVSSGDKQKVGMQIIGEGSLDNIEFQTIDPMAALKKEKASAESDLRKLEKEFEKLTDKE